MIRMPLGDMILYTGCKYVADFADKLRRKIEEKRRDMIDKLSPAPSRPRHR